MMNRTSLLLGCALAVGAAPAWAQQAESSSPQAPENSSRADTSSATTADIVVTAQRRSQTLQNVAASVSVKTGEDLRASGKTRPVQVLEDIPNVRVGIQNASTSNLGDQFVIRGITSNCTGANCGPSATAVYVDDIFSGIGNEFDVSRVEVLRGPQGTLYGRSSTSGVIAFHTTDPQLDQLSGYATGEIGSYRLARVEGALNLPLGDKVALRASGTSLYRDGYFNTRSSRRDYAGRAKLLFQPSDSLTATLGTIYVHDRTDSDGVTISPLTNDSYKITPTNYYPTNSHAWEAYGNVTDDLGFGKLTVLGSYLTLKSLGTSVNGPPFDLNNTTTTIPLDKTYTAETRLASSAGGPLQWIVGANYYHRHNMSASTALSVNSPGALVFGSTANHTVENYGVFGEATYALLDNRLRLTGGLRYDHNTDKNIATFTLNQTSAGGPPPNLQFHTPENDITGSGNNINTYKNLTYKARVEFDAAPRNMLYAMISSGFLPGSSQLNANTSTAQITPLNYAQAKLTAYEVGTKNRFFDNKLTLNADAFYYDYAGFQQSINVSATSTPIFLVFTVPARFRGVEAEGSFAITKNDRIGATFAYLKGKYHDLPASAAPFFALPAVTNTTPIRVTGNYDHIFELGELGTLTAHVDGRYFEGYQVMQLTAAQSASTLKDLTYQPAKFIGDASLTLEDAKKVLSLTGYVRNFTKKLYKTNTSIQGGAVVPTLSEPRTFGVTGTVRF